MDVSSWAPFSLLIFRLRISLQLLSELRWQWTNIPWWAARELVSTMVPTLCLDSTVSLLQLHWLKAVCPCFTITFNCIFSRMTRVFSMPMQQHGGEMDTKITGSTKCYSGRIKNCLPILLGIKPIIFRSRVWCSATESNPWWQWRWRQWCNTWSKITPLLEPQRFGEYGLYLSMKIQSSSETSHGSRPLFSLYTDHIYYFRYCMLLNVPPVMTCSKLLLKTDLPTLSHVLLGWR